MAEDYTYLRRDEMAFLPPRVRAGLEDLQRASFDNNPAATASAQGSADTAQSSADAAQAAANSAQISADAAHGRADEAYDLAFDAVPQDMGPTFAAPSSAISRAALPDYAAPTISNPPTQAEVQVIATQMQAVVQALAAVITDLRANGALHE